MAVDLLFSLTPVTGTPVDLLFGADEDVGLAPIALALVGALPAPALYGLLYAGPVTLATLAGVLAQPVLQASILAAPVTPLRLSGLLPAPALSGVILISGGTIAVLVGVLPDSPLAASMAMDYVSDTARPTVGQVGAHWQRADHGSFGVRTFMQRPIAAPAGTRAAWQPALHTARSTAVPFNTADRVGRQVTARHQDGVHRSREVGSAYADAGRLRSVTIAAYQNAQRVPTQINRQRHQDGLRDRRAAITGKWQVAQPRGAQHTEGFGASLHAPRGWAARHQDAMRPPAGIYVRPITPPRERCYTPDPDLLFSAAWSADTNLVFICERHGPALPGAAVVVPIQRTYVTINSIALRRVDGDVAIPTYAFSMSLDVDSWTWSWSASVPLDALALVQPGSSGEPVEVEARVNGVPYRLLAEGVASQRQFGQARISVKGRGKAALLDAPYAPTLNFGNAEARTAQQLMTDVLTVNGVGIGWAVDWNLTDWLVPGGTWTSQGAYIGAVLDIAQAAGGYVQPHDTAQTLRVLPRYPAAPWDWACVAPDFELPSSVVSVEGIDWTRKADYNRVFVSGTANGVLGQVTRAGTAGDSVAPMVTDSLITHAIAARQRGLAILADTGNQARVTLTLPVLSETGLIKPGQFIRYLDGSQTRLGLVRSTSLAWSRPKLRQTIAVETHV